MINIQVIGESNTNLAFIRDMLLAVNKILCIFNHLSESTQMNNEPAEKGRGFFSLHKLSASYIAASQLAKLHEFHQHM